MSDLPGYRSRALDLLDHNPDTIVLEVPEDFGTLAASHSSLHNLNTGHISLSLRPHPEQPTYYGPHQTACDPFPAQPSSYAPTSVTVTPQEIFQGFSTHHPNQLIPYSPHPNLQGIQTDERMMDPSESMQPNIHNNNDLYYPPAGMDYDTGETRISTLEPVVYDHPQQLFISLADQTTGGGKTPSQANSEWTSPPWGSNPCSSLQMNVGHSDFRSMLPKVSDPTMTTMAYNLTCNTGKPGATEKKQRRKKDGHACRGCQEQKTRCVIPLANEPCTRCTKTRKQCSLSSVPQEFPRPYQAYTASPVYQESSKCRVACNTCHKRKTKCVLPTVSGPCRACYQREEECSLLVASSGQSEQLAITSHMNINREERQWMGSASLHSNGLDVGSATSASGQSAHHESHVLPTNAPPYMYCHGKTLLNESQP